MDTFISLTVVTIFKIKHKFEIQHYMHNMYYSSHHVMSMKNDGIWCVFHCTSSDLKFQ
jgi:hypothetical protein